MAGTHTNIRERRAAKAAWNVTSSTETDGEDDLRSTVHVVKDSATMPDLTPGHSSTIFTST